MLRVERASYVNIQRVLTVTECTRRDAEEFAYGYDRLMFLMKEKDESPTPTTICERL